MAIIKWARAASYNKANTYPGANGEIVIDIEQNRLFLYDGSNAYVSNTFFQSNVYISSGAASFDWTNTPTQTKITASDGQASDNFGASVRSLLPYVLNRIDQVIRQIRLKLQCQTMCHM